MARPNLLLCFDAFGTLFSPKGSVAQQYAEVARKCGISSFSDSELQSRLMRAIKDERKRNPNYGKSTGLGATKWWTNVIHETFEPLTADKGLPRELVPALLHRFASNEGYEAAPGLVAALHALRHRKPTQLFDNIVIGVVTNSDDRVPSILSSLGLDVSPLRYGSTPAPVKSRYDIDFHCMSYDVGVEKPDKGIFEAAESMLSQVTGQSPDELRRWQKVYVGDEYAKDVVGAANAGWSPVLVGDDEGAGQIVNLEGCPDQNLSDLFMKHAALRVESIKALVSWLVGADWKESK